MPVAVDQWAERWNPTEKTKSAKASPRLQMAALFLRSVFIISLLIVTVHISLPQSSTLWTVFETPSDLTRLTLGFLVCVWFGYQLFTMPKDAQTYRTWFYLGLAAVPFTAICIVGIW
jgi:hypothetical protein